MTQTDDLTVTEALGRVLAGVHLLPPEQVTIGEALGRVLASAVVAAASLPPFANSAMDGYAVRSDDLATASRETPSVLDVVGDIAAGAAPGFLLAPGEAARIMTGAPLPDGADAVVPVEATNEPWRDAQRPLPAQITVYQSVTPGDYVRFPGEDIQAGQEVMPAGHLLRPQEIGVLASLGMAHVPVIRRPRVGVLATGDELVGVSEELAPGKIRNSNAYTQEAQIRALGAVPVPLGIARDELDDVRDKLGQGLEGEVDLFVSSAGVSVGAYDVVKGVLEAEGNVGFWRVRMRPGKPLAFGSYQGVPYLGLPGNPVSALVSFERFARPAILKMAGHTAWERPRLQVTIAGPITSDGRETYARAIVRREADGSYVAQLTGEQGSHIMTSLVQANALLVVPEGVREVQRGAQLEAMMIDWPPGVF
ncbi:MAG: molybdopterin molybdotransferase MoeA [Anaerolineae bacterium]|nr:molybdopterin molybdotransferase MoeA [Anaerolineae bacterium]